ncbi:MAG: tRNA methyltransferase 10 C [Paramarteilia canceri]
MLQKYGTVDNFPLANYYTERFDNDRVCNFLPFKLMEMNCEKKPKLIIDCGYEGQDLTMKKLLYAQFNQVYSHVKKAHSLLPIGFSSTKSALRLPDPIINLNGSGLISITDQDFSTLCEDYKEIVYLSPHSDRVLHEINSNTAYIIGGLVDIHQNLPYSIARARKFKVKTAALPLDIYFNWEKGSKSLTIDQMIKIMYTLWETGSWYDALSFVPQRKATPTRALLDLKSKAKT